MRMKMLTALCGMIHGEIGAVRPGQPYDAVSDDEARRLWASGAAVPWDGEVPKRWTEAAKAKDVSTETPAPSATDAPAAPASNETPAAPVAASPKKKTAGRKPAPTK